MVIITKLILFPAQGKPVGVGWPNKEATDVMRADEKVLLFCECLCILQNYLQEPELLCGLDNIKKAFP